VIARSPRSAILALFAAFALTFALAFAFADGPLAQTAPQKGKAAPKGQDAARGDAPFGNYLAGRYAQLHGKPGAAIDFYRAVLKNEPQNADVQRRLLAMLVSEGRIDEGLQVIRTMTDKNPDPDEDDGNLAWLTLALADMKAGKFAEADKILGEFPKSGLATIIAPLMRAWALAGQKKFDEALKSLNVEGGNEGFAVLFGAHASAINELAGRNDVAEQGYLKSVEGRQRANLRLTQLLGNFYERTGRAEQARKLYEGYLADNPTSTMLNVPLQRVASGKPPRPEISNATEGAAEGLFSLAGSVQQQSSFQAILFARLAVYLRPDFSIARLLIAETLEAEKRYEEAIVVYRSVTSDPNYAWAARLRIADQLDALERPDDAIKELRQLSQEEPKRYDALVRMGDVMRRHKRYEDAAKAYDEAKKRIPSLGKEHWSMLYASGIANERIKRWDKAEADFLKALEFDPEQPYVLNYLGYSWVEMGKNLDQARAMIELAVKKRPRDGYIVDSLGWVLYRLGDIENAVKNLERAVSLRPEDPTINDHLGDVYWHVGRKDEARFQWNRALTLEPEAEELPKIKKKVKDGLPST
jgi:tetratricopeptide (TPR) repeat protein